MITIIQTDIPVDCGDRSTTLLELQRRCIYYKEIEEKIFIVPQKISLDEEEINVIFFNILPKVDIEYSPLGGEGCEFAISVSYQNKDLR